MQEIVRIENLSFAYGKTKVLDQLNLSLDEGSWVGIQGVNGAGKSTLLHLLLGMKKKQEGEIKLFSTPIEDFRDWDKLAFVSQSGFSKQSHFPANVKELVAMPLYYKRKKGMDKKSMQKKIQDALELVHMQDYGHRQLAELSGGQQQRIQIAMALAGDAKLLFMDEPTTGLDEESTKELDRTIRYLRRRGEHTGLIISHDLTWLKACSDKIYLLDKGRLKEN